MRLIFSFGYSLFSYGIVSFRDLRSCKYLFRTETIITAEIALEKGKGTGFWRSNNYNWYLHDNLFYLGWNPGWFYVEKINVKEDSESLMKKDIIFDSPFVSVAVDSLITFYSTNL